MLYCFRSFKIYDTVNKKSSMIIIVLRTRNDNIDLIGCVLPGIGNLVLLCPIEEQQNTHYGRHCYGYATDYNRR